MNVVIYTHPKHGGIVKLFYKGESYETIEQFKRSLRSDEMPYRHHFLPVGIEPHLIEKFGITYETFTPKTPTQSTL